MPSPMGNSSDMMLLNQLKKAQGETNDRLERIAAEQKRTNDLLARLLDSRVG